MTTRPSPNRRLIASLAFVTMTAALMPPTFAAAQTQQTRDRQAPAATRLCQGRVTTLAWGAYVSDAQGRCTPTAQRVERPRVTVDRPEPCVNERRWLGGAIRICRDTPRSGATR